jgi:hypothetical protein
MRWRLSIAAVREKTSARQKPGWRVQWALVGSLAVHMVLAMVFFSNKIPRPAPLPDVVEIAFEVPEVIVAIPTSTSAESHTGNPSHAVTALTAPVSRGKDAVSHRDVASASTGAAENPAQAIAVPVPGAPTMDGASAHGEGDRLATFQPTHPDLHGPMRFPAPEGKPRDLLSLPATKNGIPSGELPKVLRGSGNVTASVADDGSIRFHDPDGIAMDNQHFQQVGQGAGVGVSFRLDVTDQVMKLAGQDPYSSTKRTMANETREQRLCMAKRYRGERQKQELFALSTKVRHIAARVDLSAAQRRELVFAIWDECSEESDSTTDYGAMARATILSILREAFPAGTDKAYQPAELLAFNERRSSRQRFAPYDPSPMTRAGHPDGGASTECP